MWADELKIETLVGEGVQRWIKYELTCTCDRRVNNSIMHSDWDKAWNQMVMADNLFTDGVIDVLRLEQDQHYLYGMIVNPLSVLRSLV